MEAHNSPTEAAIKTDFPESTMIEDKSISPSLSVILLTPGGFELLARVLRRIASQTVASQIEVIIVTPGKPEKGLSTRLGEGLYAIRLVEVAPGATMPEARAAGVRMASAPVLAFCEDHAYWPPDWAEVIMARHQEPWAAVGPAITNANPGSAVSWASLLLGYGRWLAPVAGGEIDDLPGHNSSYKRDVLMAESDDLEKLLEAESFLHRRLRAKGHRLYLEPRAVTHHVNITAPRYFLMDWLMVGRLYAAAEAQTMPPLQRFWRGLISLPAVPRRAVWPLREALRPERRSLYRIPGLLPHLLWGTLLRGLSETLGFWFKKGTAPDVRWKCEFAKERFMATEADRKAMEQF